MEVSQRAVKELIKSFTGQAQMLTIPRPFIRMTGDHECALMLNQIIYWSERTDDPDGWFYKTHEDWADELEFTPAQVRRITKALEKVGVESRLKKHNGAPKLHYRISDEIFHARLLSFLESQQSTRPIMKKVDNQESALTALSDPIINNLDNQQSTQSDNQESEESDSEESSLSSSKVTKITAKTTSKITGDERAEGEPPDWIDRKLWKRWLKFRKEINHPVKETQAEAQFAHLDKLRARGHPPADVIEQSIAHGWQGLFEIKPERNGNGANKNSNRSGQAGDQQHGNSRHRPAEANAHLRPKRIIDGT